MTFDFISLHCFVPFERRQVWELSDHDADGNLDDEEFCLALWLCEKVKQGEPLPAQLPPDLVPPSHR